MSTAEKLVFNLTLLSVFLLFVASIHYCFPSTVRVSFRRLGCLLVGHDSAKPNVGKIILDQTGDVVASLGAVPVNASTILQPAF